MEFAKFGILTTLSAALTLTAAAAMADLANREREMTVIRADLERIGSDPRTFNWSPVTPENVVEVKKLALQSSKDILVIKKHIGDMLRSRQQGDRKACGEPGRIDPEIAIELVRTAYLTNHQPGEVRDVFEAHCSKPNQTHLSDESCAELVKIALIKGRPVETVIEMAKTLRGRGWERGTTPEVIAELVKISLVTGVDPAIAYQMFRETFTASSNWFPGWYNNTDPRNSVELVKTALLKGERDTRPYLMNLKAIYGYGGFRFRYSYDHDSATQVVKLAALTNEDSKKLFDLTTGQVSYLGQRFVTPSTAPEIVKLAFHDVPKIKDLLKFDHKIRGAAVDRSDCAAGTTPQQPQSNVR